MPGRTSHPLHADIAALERTALAWERTALGVAALGTLLLKAPQTGALAQAFGVVLLAAGIALILLSPVGYALARRDLVSAERGSGAAEAFGERTVRVRHRAVLGTALALSAAAAAVAVEVLWTSLRGR